VPTRIEHMLLALLSRQPSTATALAKRLGKLPLGGRGTSSGAVYPAVRRLEAAGLVATSPRPPNEAEAVYRKRARGLVRGTSRGTRRATRGVRLHRLTNDGWMALREWAGRVPDRDEMRRRPDELLLRFLVLARLDSETDPDERAGVIAPPGYSTGPNVPPQWRIGLQGARPHSHPGDEGRTRVFLEDYARVALEVACDLRTELRRARRKPRAGRHPLHWLDYDGSWERRLATDLMVSLFEARAIWAHRAAMELDRERPIRRGPALDQVIELARFSRPRPRTGPSRRAGAGPPGSSRASW